MHGRPKYVSEVLITADVEAERVTFTGRSATIVAAYLMYARNLDVAGALALLQKARPSI